MNYSGNSSFPETVCTAFNTRVFDISSLGIAIPIIVALSFLIKRVHRFPNVCGGKPGLLVPVNFLQDSHKNRLTYAVAFGAIAGSCFKMFGEFLAPTNQLDSVFLTTHWAKAFYGIAMVLFYGIINFPIFACLMTEYKLHGAILGLLYTLLRFIGLMVASFYCQFNSGGSLDDIIDFLVELPVILCHLVLLIRFTYLLYHEVHRKYWGNTDPTTNESRDHVIAADQDIIHVKLLLRNRLDIMSVGVRPWYIKLRDKIYKPRPDFKFSTQIISTMAVVAVFIYTFTVYGLYLMWIIDKKIEQFKSNVLLVQLILKHISVAGNISVFLSAAFTTGQMLHFLKCHRDQVLMSYKTKSHPNPARLVGRSLSYSGYQIGYVGLSVIIFDIFSFLVIYLIALLIEFLPLFLKSPEYKQELIDILLGVLPIIVVPLFVFIFQFLVAILVFRNREFPNITVTIDNQRLFCIFSYFFLLFNILVGLWSAVLRGLKSMVLGVAFVARLDRTPLMRQFENIDAGYMSYIGFLDVLKSFSHPVMLVFCQLLKNKEQHIEANDNGVFIADQTLDPVLDFPKPVYVDSLDERPVCYSTSRRRALNRWLVAKTLIRNPSLIKYRKTADRTKHVASLTQGDIHVAV